MKNTAKLTYKYGGSIKKQRKNCDCNKKCLISRLEIRKAASRSPERDEDSLPSPKKRNGYATVAVTKKVTIKQQQWHPRTNSNRMRTRLTE